MKLFSVMTIITIAFTAKSQNITKTMPYEPPPPPPPPDCQPRRKLTADNSPWIPGLYFLQDNGNIERRQCAVSLIADRVAITTPICVPKYTELDDGMKKKHVYYLRPTESIHEDDFRVVIDSAVHEDYDLALLYVNRPVCADKVCWPPKQAFYEWSHCFVVGNHRIPQEDIDYDDDDNEPSSYREALEEQEEDETSLPCEIHYNVNLVSGMTKSADEWSNYTSTESIIHVKGKENAGTCVVNTGSPMMCATKISPNHYFQAGVVVNRRISEYECNNTEYLCITGNFSQILKSCPGIDYNTAVDLCNGFDILNTGKDEIKNWIDETVNNWTKNEGPLAWKPICKDSGAVEVQYNEFPWMAAIFNPRGKSSSRGTFVCAATVIHSRMALTRRECVERGSFAVTQLYLLTGVRNLDHVREYGSHGERERRRQLSGYITMSKNENYKEDMVVIYWDKPLQNTDFPQLAQNGEHFHNMICLTLGWGLHSRKPDEDEPTYHATLKKAEVPTYDSHSCYIKLARSVYPDLSPRHLDGFICAGGKHPIDVCLVDQGGPLVCQRDDHTLVLAGVMSYAPGCGNEDTPNIYNSIESLIVKIRKIMDTVANSTNSYYHCDNTESNDVMCNPEMNSDLEYN